MNIAVYALKFNVENLNDYFTRFFDFLKTHEINIFLWEEMIPELSKLIDLNQYSYTTYKNKEDLKPVDRFFTFGGDGTILSAITIVEDSNIPIVGINTGRLGFLASIHVSDFMQNMNEFCLGKLSISYRSLISIEGTNVEKPYALNELAVLRKETTSMITIDAYVNHEFLNTFWADGLIISTPTGSTGYSMSCGGPIISPENSDLVITPISPHNLNVRPIIIPDNSHIKLKIHSRVPKFSMSLDSRLNSIKTSSEIMITKANWTIQLAFPIGYNYYTTLRKKLLWGVDSRN